MTKCAMTLAPPAPSAIDAGLPANERRPDGANGAQTSLEDRTAGCAAAIFTRPTAGSSTTVWAHAPEKVQRVLLARGVVLDSRRDPAGLHCRLARSGARRGPSRKASAHDWEGNRVAIGCERCKRTKAEERFASSAFSRSRRNGAALVTRR